MHNHQAEYLAGKKSILIEKSINGIIERHIDTVNLQASNYAGKY